MRTHLCFLAAAARARLRVDSLDSTRTGVVVAEMTEIEGQPSGNSANASRTRNRCFWWLRDTWLMRTITVTCSASKQATHRQHGRTTAGVYT